MFGLGWTSNVEDRIYVGGDYLLKHLRGDGSIWSYGFSGYSQDGSAAFVGLGDQGVAVEDEQHAPLRVHRLDGQVEDYREKFRKRAIFGKLLAGSNQRLHGACGLGPGRAAIDGHGLAGKRALQAGDHGRSSRRTAVPAFEDHHAGFGIFGIGREDHHQVPRRDAVPRLQNEPGLERDVVDEGAVLALHSAMVRLLPRPMEQLGAVSEVSLSSRYQAWDVLERQTQAVCFIGHTHRPSVSVLKAGLLVEERPEVIAIEQSHRYLINVGSVGQPRNHDPRCSYVIHDGDAQTVTFRKVDYPVSITQRRIREQNLPDRLAERLAVGV